ncbi:MAG: LamG domain-containing protein [Myxococcales bacterium]|nr:LamG domain-containing protein [Myxococcales bacterium]
MPRVWVVVLVGVVVGIACAPSGAFLCESDEQCVDAGGAGVCQIDGRCSFPDDDCPSGQRYGAHSGPLSGQCVGPAGSGSSSGEPPDTATGEAATTGPSDEGTTLEDDGDTEVATTGEPLDPDLVLWLELEGGGGSVVPDSSTSMADGSCAEASCPVAAPGAVGLAAGFDGVDDAIVVPHHPAFVTTEGLTVALWLWLDEVPAEHRAVVTKPVGNDIGNSWELYFYPQVGVVPLQLNVDSGGSSHVASSGEPLPVRQWVHVAATWDGAVATLWIDAQPIDSVEVAAIDFDEQAIHVGADDDHEGLLGFFGGSLDDLRVYRRALSSDELAVLASLP